MLRRDVVVVSFLVRGDPWQKRRILYGSLVPSSASEPYKVSIWRIHIITTDVLSNLDGTIFVCLRDVFRSKLTLLFACECSKRDRRLGLISCEYTSKLQGNSHTGGVVDGNGSIALIINWVAVPRIIMPSCHVEPLWIFTNCYSRDNAGGIDRKNDSLVVAWLFDEAIPFIVIPPSLVSAGS
jgi:hypothetical protein